MPKVLFLCTGNSCRSQMAEGWLRHLVLQSPSNINFEAVSAGLEPSTVNPLAINVMAEIGIDISHQTSKDVCDFLGQFIPFLITVCDRAKDRCPIFPGISYREHWPIRDPAAATGSDEEVLAIFREVRDDIGNRVRHFVQRNS